MTGWTRSDAKGEEGNLGSDFLLPHARLMHYNFTRAKNRLRM